MANAFALGSWGATITMPTVPVAAMMLPTGKILVFSSSMPMNFETDIGDMPSDTDIAFYDTTTGVVSPLMQAGVEADMFCPSISALPNGDILIAGGSSSDHTSLYNPFTGQYGQWSDSANLNIPRGYNASVTLSNGDVFTIGGSWSGAPGPKDGEVWSPTGGWELTGIPGSVVTAPDLLDEAQGFVQFGDDHQWLFAMPNNEVFDAGPGNQMWFFNPLAGTYTSAGTRGNDPYSVNGDAVMFAPGMILTVGGAQAYTNKAGLVSGVNSSNAAYLINITQDYTNPAAMPVVTQLAPMNFARAYSNAVVLPDGEVFIVGGQTQPLQFTDINAVMTPEMWSPVTQQFTELAPMPVPRDYHSTALLMPDGRIWVGGGGDFVIGDTTDDPSATHPDFNIYTPPYLYAPDGSLAVRPVINSAPATLALGNALTVTASTNVTSFDLVRMGTSTHSLDTDQRRIPLTIQSAANGTYTLAVPSDPGITVPGYWMLFALNASGVPSVSSIIQVETGGPTVAATSNWTADTDTEVWFQNDSGPLAVWQISGGNVVNSNVVSDDPGPSWHAMGKGNFFGDGNTGIVWQNDDGAVALWDMSGANPINGVVLPYNPGPTWHIEGTGDFFGDGNTDILWQNDDGAVALWDISGGNAIAGTVLPSNPGPSWHVEGTGDFFGDGNTDILWQNDDGAVALWDMSGGNAVAGEVLPYNPGPTWHIMGTGDFFGDGNSDILWQNDDGAVALWDLSGGNAVGELLPNNPGPSWHIKGVGNYFGDGTTDIVWQNDDGSIALWDMSGGNAVNGEILPYNPGGDWTIFDDNMRFIYSASANETLTAAAATPDEFVFTSFAAGTHTIAGFNPMQDMIEFSQTLFPSFADVQAAISKTAGGAMISLGQGSSLELPGVNPATLHPGNFALA